MASGTEPVRKMLLAKVLAVAVVAVVALSLLGVYYSPHLSWSSSIRDHDGDGVPDSSDPEPEDETIWGECEAYVDIKVNNTTDEALFWHIDVWSSDLPENLTVTNINTTLPNEMMAHLLELSWLCGPSSVEIELCLFATISSDWMGYSWHNESMVIASFQTETVSLTVPDDFSLSMWYG